MSSKQSDLEEQFADTWYERAKMALVSSRDFGMARRYILEGRRAPRPPRHPPNSLFGQCLTEANYCVIDGKHEDALAFLNLVLHFVTNNSTIRILNETIGTIEALRHKRPGVSDRDVSQRINVWTDLDIY